ncbi:MAG: DsrE family protein [Rubrobacter sp.]|nr:DsrE family protein [Rubrobacter sp.]MDQ3531211.1 DsrE family protein [Actinomycetota bacterium]
MNQVAILVLAGTETKADLGRVVNGLQVAREFKEAGDDVTVIFDGAGTQWVPVLSDPDHKYHTLWEQTKDVVEGVCSYCANAYGVKEEIEASDQVELIDEFDGHPSIRKLVDTGYQVITF